MGSTKALLHFNGVHGGTNIIDSTGLQSWAVFGGAELGTVSGAYGNTALNFKVIGTNSGAQATSNANFLPGTNDFTVEARIRYIAGGRIFYNEAGNPGIQFDCSAGMKITGAFRWDTPLNQIAVGGNTTVGTTDWYHVAMVRSGTSLKMYINGTAETTVGNVSTLSAIGSAGTAQIGYSAVGTSYIDEFRYSNVARYTTNFTPPTNEFQLVNLMPSIFN